MILVTGGCGFIGSAFVLQWLEQVGETVVNLDFMTYAGHPGNLASVEGQPTLRFVHGDICDPALVSSLLDEHRPRAVIHFAAESHVDRSIHGPAAFVQTNVVGTMNLLQSATTHYKTLDDDARRVFRFVHVSTDEVFGSLAPGDAPFSEAHPYLPNSPYAASKASSDHLVRAWHHTFGLPTLTTNCSNNYGPRQFPEKLIPLVIHRALQDEPIPLYGDGKQVRDWLHVNDHCRAIRRVLDSGQPGETYNIGGRSERTNLEVVSSICSALDTLRPRARGRHAELVTHVADRPGHDRRYAIDDRKIASRLGWKPDIRFEDGIQQTVQWYLDNPAWVESVTSGSYRQWVKQHYA